MADPPSASASRSRRLVVVVLIVALIATVLTRQVAFDAREAGNRGLGNGSRGNSLSRMNTYALALLLGGLRGPLVMFLWPTTESQKQHKDLEDLDTRIEWIRLLQAEFDTVHLFQIWNKAYNISVLRANVGNKYLTIIDALDYARSVDRERPDDINIIYAIGGLYFDKLGLSAEKWYYRPRVRHETLPHRSSQKISRDDPAWRRADLDPMLDEQGIILPSLLQPTLPQPLVDPYNPRENYDGSDLEFLKQFEPFPKGISPLALGYNYYKRSQMLIRRGMRHAQLTDRVLDSRPALALENWATEDNDLARGAELRAFGLPVPPDSENLVLPTANVSMTTPATNPKQFPDAIYFYRRCAMINRAGDAEFINHLAAYPDDIDRYENHQLELRANAAMADGDGDYLKAFTSTGDARTQALQSSANAYALTLDDYAYIILRYYIPDPVAAKTFPSGVPRPEIGKVDRKLYPNLVASSLAMEKQMHYQIDEDTQDYLRKMARCQQRINLIHTAGVSVR